MSDYYTIIVARPVSKADPIFMKDEQGYLFPRVLKAYRQLGLIQDYCISMPDLIPEEHRAIFREWGVNCSYSPHDKPQLRVNDIAKNTNASKYLLITPYAYLLDKDCLQQAKRLLNNQSTHVVTNNGTNSSNQFTLCDRHAINALGRLKDFVVTPFSLHKYAVEELGNESVVTIPESRENNALTFLSKVLYYGKSGILPEDLIAQYFRTTPESSLFTLSSFERCLSDYFTIDDFSVFAESLARYSPMDMQQRAAQILYLSRIKPFFPQRRGRFIEVGYGSAPTTSMFLLNEFESGIAIEPFRDTSADWKFVETISRHIPTLFDVSFSRTHDCSNLADSLIISDRFIEDMNIENESVDFIFSKTVFEHVMDVETTSRQMYDLLRPGGKMYHVIGHQDHVDCKTFRFDFLKYDRKTWCEIQSHTNLWRINDFVDYWTELGFKVDVIERESRIVEVPEIHPSWNDYSDEDLFCYHSAILAEKQ